MAKLPETKVKFEGCMGPIIGALRDLTRHAARSKRFAALVHQNFEGLGVDVVQRDGKSVSVPNSTIKNLLAFARSARVRSRQFLRPVKPKAAE